MSLLQGKIKIKYVSNLGVYVTLLGQEVYMNVFLVELKRYLE
jgi:hypothetical protein